MSGQSLRKRAELVFAGKRQPQGGGAFIYWLSRCEGFQVDDENGRVGVVDHILHEPRSSLPQTLAVRTGLFARHQLDVPVDAVESVDAARSRIIVR